MDLKPETLEEIEKLVRAYPDKRSALMMILHAIQEEVGYIPEESYDFIGGKLDLEPIKIYEVVTFYPMYRQKPIGLQHVKVCRTLSCALRGAYHTCDKLQEALDCPLHGTSKDGAFTIEFVECLASCGTAPVVMVDEVLHENITPEKADAFADELKKNAGQPAGA